MDVRRDPLPEHRQRRLPVAARVVAEHLVVRAILFDDVDDVLERRQRRRRCQRRFEGRVRARDREAADQRAARQRSDRLKIAGRHIRRVVGRRALRRGRDRAVLVVRVGVAGKTFAVELVEALAVLAHRDVCGIPTDGQRSVDQRCRPGDVDRHDRIRIGVGDEQRAPVSGQRKRAWRRALRRAGIQRRIDLAAQLIRDRVDHVDDVVVGAGDVQRPSVGAEQHRSGVAVGRDGPELGAVRGVDDADGSTAPA